MQGAAVSKASSNPSICFVSHFAYGALSGAAEGHIGGVEHQTSLMARWFAAREYRVSMLTWDEGQPEGIEIDGVRVYKICVHNAGLPGARFFHPRWTGLMRAMRNANANIYYQNCAEYVTGQVALWCHHHSRKFIYSVASLPDCDTRLPKLKTIRERLLYRRGLRQADSVIVQSQAQRQMLLDGFGVDTVVLPMPCPGPSDDSDGASPTANAGSDRVLWVGRICEVKRPDRLLDVARDCPNFMFDVVGPGDDAGYVQQMRRCAEETHNIILHGPVAWDRLSQFYRRALCLCCTSDYEGFPNTFLEAWSHGLPVVSTFDPDDLIISGPLGATGRTAGQLAGAIRGLHDQLERWRRISENCRRYYLQNHTVAGTMKQFERVFLDTLKRPRPTRRHEPRLGDRADRSDERTVNSV